jgi:flagella basal body P-ring formation protein FlgA
MYKFLIPILFFSFSVEAAQVKALVLNKDIKRGQSITEDDVELEIIEDKTSNDFMTSLGSRPIKAIGNMKKGKSLKVSDLIIDRFLVHKGDTITVKFVRKNLVIETQGISLTNGTMKDMVKIKNLDSNKIVRGIVSGEREVKIPN